MKNSIILAYPRVQFEDNYPYTWLPYSLLAIASALPKDDFNVIIFDENRDTKKQFKNLLRSTKNVICVGFSVMTGGCQIGNAIKLAEIVKQFKSDIPIVFGGPHVNVLPDETLRHPLVDIILSGPGQKSFPLLARALCGEIAFADVPGLLMFDGGRLVKGPINILNKDTLVPYMFQLTDVDSYIKPDKTIASRTINYISTQGCIYKCRFCYETNYKKKYGKLPCEIVIQDIEYFVSRYAVNGVKFYDADWFIDEERARCLIAELTRLKINWAASINPIDILRANKKGSQLMKKLATSNCKRLLMGVESGNNRILKDVVNKGVTKDKMLSVAKIIARHGILGSYTFIVGFPGETVEEQEETFDFIEELWNLQPRPETRVHIYTPYPGTPLYEEAKKCGFVPPNKFEDWSNFDYYKANTPWVDYKLESRVREFTSMICKM